MSEGARDGRVVLLGLVQIALDGRTVPLTPSERSLLAGVAVHRGRTVSASALAEWIWGSHFPSSPRNRVQALVSGIRRKTAGSADVLLTDGSGYRLAPGVTCDLDEWQSLRQKLAGTGCTAEERRQLLQEATTIGSGTPLDGCHDSPAVSQQRRHLQEIQLELLGERVDADLAAGHHRGLVAELTSLVEANPFHETFAAQLMQILALGGRQAEALGVYRRTYRLLDEELGVQPGSRLRQTQLHVLDGGYATDPALGGSAADEGPAEAGSDASNGDEATSEPPRRPRPHPRTVPRPMAELVGRDRELAGIMAAAESAGSRPAVVSVTGLGGVGKSTLAIEAAHRLRDRFPDGSLYLAMNSETGRAGAGSVLELFLGLLGVGPAGIPASRDARAALFRSVLDERRALIVLDDVPDGFDVSDLLPARPTSMAIMTSRRPLTAAEPTLHVRLTSLGADDAVALLASIVGTDRVDASTEEMGALARTCGGLPLLLRLIGQRLARRPDVPLGSAALGLADELTDQSDARDGERILEAGLGLAEAPLPESTRVVLQDLAALPFPRVSRWVFAALAGSESAGERALDQLVDAGFVDPVLHDGWQAQYQLHDLVRLHARRSAATSDRSSFAAGTTVAAVAGRFLQLARENAAAFPALLLPLPPDEHGERPPETDGAGPTPDEALRFFRTEHDDLQICARAAARAHPSTAWRLLALAGNYARGAIEPTLWCSITADVRAALTTAGRDGERGRAYLDLAEALLRHESADSVDAIPLARRARRAMVLDGDTPGALAAAVVLGRAHRATGEGAEAEEALDWASRSAGPDVPTTTRAYIELAWGSLHDDYDRLLTAREHLRRALTGFETTQDWSGLATTQYALARVHRRLGEYREGLPLADSAMLWFDRLGDQNGHTAALDTRADLLVYMGDPVAALPDAAEAVDRAGQRRDEFMLHRAQRTLGRAQAGLGRLADAERALWSSAEGFERLGRPLSLAATLRDIGLVLQRQNRVDEARTVLVRERGCLITAGVQDLSELDALVGRLEHSRTDERFEAIGATSHEGQ